MEEPMTEKAIMKLAVNSGNARSLAMVIIDLAEAKKILSERWDTFSVSTRHNNLWES